jgi:hypothetical protein
MNKEMNFYYYWFFFVYNIYHKFSKDRDFYIFATGMFSAFIIALEIFCSDFISYCFNIPSILFSHGVVLPCSTGVLIVIGNLYLFAYKGKHINLFSRYLEAQSTIKDILCFFLSLWSLAYLLFFYDIFVKK